jgi:phosphoribosylcarboxyaminoimidazole (NCAIR) mutase
MPRGVSVASVAINGGLNACLLAARILGASDENIRLKLEDYAGNMGNEAVEKAARLENIGFENYKLQLLG